MIWKRVDVGSDPEVGMGADPDLDLGDEPVLELELELWHTVLVDSEYDLSIVLVLARTR
jgi:hypothetical protein